jgi:hypothetical protein
MGREKECQIVDRVNAPLAEGHVSDLAVIGVIDLYNELANMANRALRSVILRGGPPVMVDESR